MLSDSWYFFKITVETSCFQSLSPCLEGEVIIGTVTSCGCCHLKKKKKPIEFSEAFECVSDYCSKNWAAATVPISSVISIKGCKSIANFTSLLVQFLCWENPLVKDLSGSGRKIAEEAFGSHFLQREYEHALCYNSLNIPQALDGGIKFSIPRVTFSLKWREEQANSHCFTAALIELKKMHLLSSSFPPLASPLPHTFNYWEFCFVCFFNIHLRTKSFLFVLIRLLHFQVCKFFLLNFFLDKYLDFFFVLCKIIPSEMSCVHSFVLNSRSCWTGCSKYHKIWQTHWILF